MKVLENEKDKLKIEIPDLTLVNLLNEMIWEQKGVDFASYNVDHPYLSQPVLLVKSKNPKKTIEDAGDSILKDIAELKKHLEKEL